ncbi:MAG: sugar phosphate isomerase/epimerase [Victivallaceae bacterium]|nr:sugar phosphate isomerase/epimerase [Victivallaceae bacterium]
MARPLTLFTAQFSDMPFDRLCRLARDCGYDGLELSTLGGYLDIEQAADDPAYCRELQRKLKSYGLRLWAISNHFAGQLVCDPDNDSRTDCFAPARCAGDAEAKRTWAVACMKASARAAHNLDVKVVTGFTGSPIWHLFYSFPPVCDEEIAAGFRYFAEKFHPILDEFAKYQVKFALEVHPTEIAFDLHTAGRALEAIGNRREFGFNFDPSHLFWQGVDPVRFLKAFPDRIYHCHIKDAALSLDGENGILNSHWNFGDVRRGWDFRSPGHGEVDFEGIVRQLNRIGYDGPLSVEWEDCGMDREFGARDAAAFTRKLDFTASAQQFDSAFQSDEAL